MMTISAPARLLVTAADPSARTMDTSPPIIARVAQDKLLLDVRCLRDEDLETVAMAVRALGVNP